MFKDIMFDPRFMPTAQILLSLGACLAYCVKGDAGRSVYWGAAAVLTYSVTWIMK